MSFLYASIWMADAADPGALTHCNCKQWVSNKQGSRMTRGESRLRFLGDLQRRNNCEEGPRSFRRGSDRGDDLDT